MKYNSKNNFNKFLLALFVISALYIADSILSMNFLPFSTQNAALFGVSHGDFTPYAEKTSYDIVRSQVLWAIFIVSVLLVTVITYVFDITDYAQKVTGKKIINGNKITAWLLLAALVIGMYFATWEFIAHGKFTKTFNASSEHGLEIDRMFMVVLVATVFVFVVTQAMLFIFSFIYQEKEGRKAYYYPHNNTLELLWTAVPFVSLLALAMWGYRAWSGMMYDLDKKENVIDVEVFAYQFGWTARYPGDDGKLGAFSFDYISGTNQLGLAVPSEVEKLKKELKKDTANYAAKLNTVDSYIADLRSDLAQYEKMADAKKVKSTKKKIKKAENGEYEADMKDMLRIRTKQLERMALAEANTEAYNNTFNGDAFDDVIVKEIVAVKNKPIRMKFRSKDVIHSALAPDFRVQMNVVPGMTTQFMFTPIKTTQEIRDEKDNQEFEYYMYCNKICGQAHFNMKIKITVVETEAELQEWLKSKSPAYPDEPKPKAMALNN